MIHKKKSTVGQCSKGNPPTPLPSPNVDRPRPKYILARVTKVPSPLILPSSTFNLIRRVICVGQTSLFSGHRVAKTDSRVQALGANDELSSALGVAMEFCRLQSSLASTVDQLIFVQRRLQELNGHLASSGARAKTGEGEETIKATTATSITFDADGSFTRQLEQWIDEMDATLPALTSFILPVRTL